MLLEFLLIPMLCLAGKDLRAAIQRAGLSIKEAAGYMGIDHAQLSRQLDGIENVSMKRFDALPLEVQREFYVLGAARVGLPKSIRVGQRLRMARARLHAFRDQEKRHA